MYNQDTSKLGNNPVEPYQSKSMICQELFTGDSLLELCNSFWKPSMSANVQPYLRGCKWSPDGTCCLSVVNSDGIHIMELPRDLYEGCPTRERRITLLPAVVHVKEGGLLYDFCWYPKMNSYIPETCSWLTTKKNSPIQMWDAYDGSLRSSYRGFNAVDEMEPALSATFISEGSRIVGGYRHCLRTFDVNRPGRDFIEHKIKSTASCITTKDRLLAVGTWDKAIQLFCISDMGTYKSIGNIYGHSGGITHMQFTPDGTKLVSGARKDNKLLVWDLRHYREPLNILHRCVWTNQTIYFDISSCGRYLVSGGSDGVIRVWDDKHIQWSQKFNVNKAKENATYRFHVHQDSCNSVSIHPSRPILATGSGQFHFIDPIKVLDEESDNSCDDESIQQITNTPQLEIADTFTEKSQESTSVNETPRRTEVGIQVDIELKNNSNTELSNDGKKLNSNQVEVPYHDTSQGSVEAHTKCLSIDTHHKLHVDITNTKRLLEEHTVTPLNNIVDIHDQDVCLEPPCKRRALETTSESPVVSVEINETIDKINLDIASATNNECKQFSSNGKPNVITENNGKNSDIIDIEQMNIEKEFSSKVECNKSNGRLQEQNKDCLFESEKVILYKPPELCEIDNDFEPHTKSASLNKSREVKLHTVSELNNASRDINYENSLIYSPYAENNLTFWWTSKIFDAV